MKIHVIKVKAKCLFLKLSKKKVKLIWGHDNAFLLSAYRRLFRSQHTSRDMLELAYIIDF